MFNPEVINSGKYKNTNGEFDIFSSISCFSIIVSKQNSLNFLR